MRTRWAMVIASSCGLLASCSLATTWDGLTSIDAGAGGSLGGGGSQGSGGSAGAGTDGDTDAQTDVVHPPGCTAKSHYCGGNKLEGDAGTLYTCNADGTGSLLEACAHGCLVVGTGQDDICKCQAGGYYCGGDHILGDPSTLYTCKADGSGTLLKHCANGCMTNVGKDDSCK
jgi:hypothetical protein